MYTFTSRGFSIQIVGDMGPGCLRKVFVGVVVFVVADVVDTALTAAPVHTLSLCNTQQPVASSSQPAASITPQTPFPHSHLSAYPVPPSTVLQLLKYSFWEAQIVRMLFIPTKHNALTNSNAKRAH